MPKSLIRPSFSGQERTNEFRAVDTEMLTLADPSPVGVVPSNANINI